MQSVFMRIVVDSEQDLGTSREVTHRTCAESGLTYSSHDSLPPPRVHNPAGTIIDLWMNSRGSGGAHQCLSLSFTSSISSRKHESATAVGKSQNGPF